MSNVTPTQVKGMMVECMLRAADDGCGAGDCYCICNMDMRIWGIVRDLLIEQKWAVVSKSHFVTLTPLGQSVVDECRQPA